MKTSGDYRDYFGFLRHTAKRLFDGGELSAFQAFLYHRTTQGLSWLVTYGSELQNELYVSNFALLDTRISKLHSVRNTSLLSQQALRGRQSDETTIYRKFLVPYGLKHASLQKLKIDRNTDLILQYVFKSATFQNDATTLRNCELTSLLTAEKVLFDRDRKLGANAGLCCEQEMLDPTTATLLLDRDGRIVENCKKTDEVLGSLCDPQISCNQLTFGNPLDALWFEHALSRTEGDLARSLRDTNGRMTAAVRLSQTGLKPEDTKPFDCPKYVLKLRSFDYHSARLRAPGFVGTQPGTPDAAVAEMLRRGMSEKRIAEVLCFSRARVRRLASEATEQAGLENQEQLVLCAGHAV